MDGSWTWERAATYDRPAPRYTSYPTVPWWTPVGKAAVTAAMAKGRERSRPVSVYVHLPFCVRMCLYCGCNVVVARKYDPVPRYLAALRREIDAWAIRLGG